MRLVSFEISGRAGYGVLTTAHDGREQVIDATSGPAREVIDPAFRACVSLEDVLALGDGSIELLQPLLQNAGDLVREPDVVHPVEAVTLLPPIVRPPKIVCVGVNYRDHAAEAGLPIPDFPVLFSKYTSSLVGHRTDVVIPAVSSSIDYEGEIVFVIGKRGHSISREAALEYVLGYSIMNDVSSREYQFRTSQWMVGKTFDTFAPFGPAIVTPDEIVDPSRMGIRTWVNGELRQSSSAQDMVFDVASLIEYMSEIWTLEPGDVVATGTPAGIGSTRKPPVFLVHGDTVRIEVEGVGTLENRVV